MEPGWWPPAIGWWLLSLLLIVLVVTFLWWRRRAEAARRSAGFQAMQGLDALEKEFDGHGDKVKLAADISVLLRRASISVFPREESAGLTGEDWLRFLDRQVDGEGFSRGAGRVLVEAPYRRDVDIEEVDALFELCRNWIEGLENVKESKRQ